jgi:hypothetical protein
MDIVPLLGCDGRSSLAFGYHYRAGFTRVTTMRTFDHDEYEGSLEETWKFGLLCRQGAWFVVERRDAKGD